MNSLNKFSNILVLGAGQIGLEVARQILKYKPNKLILHVYKKDEIEYIHEMIKPLSEKSDVEVHFTYGDIFLPYWMVDEKNEHNEKNRKRLMKYFYIEPNEETLKESFLYKVIKQWRPNIIIDSINTATVFGNDYNINYEKISEIFENIDINTIKNFFNKYLLDNFVPKIINFILALKLSIEDYKIDKYLKISTTGLGGMGMNISFSHGDLVKYCMSHAIMGKVASAGILHQLLLSLSHTPGFNISVIVPASCVGYEKVGIDVVENIYGKVKVVDNEELQNLEYGKILTGSNQIDNNKTNLKIPLVFSGENKAYSLNEIAALTAYGQMELVTKEEVAEIVIRNLEGIETNDLLRLMDLASIGSTYKGRRIREIIIEKMKSIECSSNITSLITGNLGPTTAKHISELYLLKLVSKNSLNKIIETNINDLCELLKKEITTNKEVRSHILSVGLPILFEGDNYLIGSKWLVPEENESQIINNNNVDCWAKKGWVDLRAKNILSWKSKLANLKNDIESQKEDDKIFLSKDIHAMDGYLNVGEVLAYLYILEGKGRREVG